MTGTIPAPRYSSLLWSGQVAVDVGLTLPALKDYTLLAISINGWTLVLCDTAPGSHMFLTGFTAGEHQNIQVIVTGYIEISGETITLRNVIQTNFTGEINGEVSAERYAADYAMLYAIYGVA